MPRYVILEHDHPTLHWDFMLEHGETLKTWRLTALPGSAAATIAAEPIGDHRPAYLDYEGPVSGGRGSVRRWDAGEYVLEESQPPRYRLQGARWRGMVHAAGASLVFVPDPI